jgi:UDP-N-acetylglucosamine--N-acetylmuramyl-(pentapeptide) pyrophosphoryl-undecaprenol N-acetylglucosamine transferase
MTAQITPSIAIACGGTGGHLFPGLAVAGPLVRQGCRVTLLISPKEVDQQAVKAASGMEIVTLPAVGLTRGRGIAFLRGSFQSYRAAARQLRIHCPQAVMTMGGFTGAPAILVGKRLGALTFIHESNTVPGRANRWLARWVDRVFVGFPQAAARLCNRNLSVTGTPVRPQFQARDPVACRTALGLLPEPPVLLVAGGSQGASPINDVVAVALPLLVKKLPRLQLLHLAGPRDAGRIRKVCSALGVKAVVHEFFADMELALCAATVALSRAGASSLAEFAAMRVPAVLIPYAAATDDHQLHNARALAEQGAARVLEEKNASPEALVESVLDLFEKPDERERMQTALARWHTPRAAEQIAGEILNEITRRAGHQAWSGPIAGEARALKSARPPVERQNVSVA